MTVISIVGKKNSGKTTLIEGLIEELKKRGYSVGTIKHIPHAIDIFEVDQEGKDSFRHFKAGADTVMISSPRFLALFKNLSSKMPIEEIVPLFSEVDIVLTEGFKDEKMAKIEVVREDGPICKKEDNLIALVSNKDFNLDILCFRPNDYPGIASLIEDFIKKKPYSTTELFVDGKKIPLNEFVKNMFKETIYGMIRSLKSIPQKVKKIEVKIIDPKVNLNRQK